MQNNFVFRLLFPSVPCDFFLSIFLTKIGGKMHFMNRLGKFKDDTQFLILLGAKKSVLQSTGGLYPQVHLLN